MKIGLVDVDGHAKKKKWGATIYPNIALCKISRWHKQKGDDVEWALPFYHYDRIYMSKVFTFSPDDLTVYDAGEIVKGGTGYDDYKSTPPHCLAATLRDRQDSAGLFHLFPYPQGLCLWYVVTRLSEPLWLVCRSTKRRANSFLYGCRRDSHRGPPQVGVDG